MMFSYHVPQLRPLGGESRPHGPNWFLLKFRQLMRSGYAMFTTSEQRVDIAQWQHLDFMMKFPDEGVSCFLLLQNTYGNLRHIQRSHLHNIPLGGSPAAAAPPCSCCLSPTTSHLCHLLIRLHKHQPGEPPPESRLLPDVCFNQHCSRFLFHSILLLRFFISFPISTQRFSASLTTFSVSTFC